MTANAGPEVPVPPEPLLAPLLDVAGDLLRTLEAGDVPTSLRPLAAFKPEGLARGPARQQLLRAFEAEPRFRTRAIERFLERPEVGALLEAWVADQAAETVDAAVERDDLPMLASALFAGRPDGWVYGLGVVRGAFEHARRRRADDDDVKALRSQLAENAEACRRLEGMLETARADAARLESDLRDERRSRRQREEQAARDVEAAARRAADADAGLARVQAAREAVEARVGREAKRALDAENELRGRRRELRDVKQELAVALSTLERSAAPGTGLRRGDLESLLALAGRVQVLSGELGGLAARARRALDAAAVESDEAGVTAARGRAAPPPRSPVPVPPGMVADAPEAIEAMLRTPGLAVFVDGYNVSMQAWPDTSPATQRERLHAAMAGLHQRHRCSVTVVFDGADVGASPPPARITGVRTTFSEPGEEADAVVVREVQAQPPAVPVLVVSSDRWVREHAEVHGARVLGASSFLAVLR